jgi:hypothetical protein
MRFADAPKSKSGPAAESEPLKASPAVAWKVADDGAAGGVDRQDRVGGVGYRRVVGIAGADVKPARGRVDRRRAPHGAAGEAGRDRVGAPARGAGRGVERDDGAAQREVGVAELARRPHVATSWPVGSMRYRWMELAGGPIRSDEPAVAVGPGG